MELGPEAVEVMFPLVFTYEPATTPFTLTLKLHDALAESCNPVILIVDVAEVAVIVGAVTTEPVVQEIVDNPLGLLMVNPVGSESEKLIPAKAVAFGFVKVKLNVLAPPCEMVGGAKLLDNVGTVGLGHPVTLTVSKYMVAVEFCAPAAYTRKYTVGAVVVVLTVMPPTCHAFALFQTAEPPVGIDQLVPSVLKSTYQLCAFDQLPCML